MKHTLDVKPASTKKADLHSRLSSVPRRPGVYVFTGSGEKVLYVGKAKDLRARLGSYFRSPAGLDPRKASMVRDVRDFSTIVTDNELEALALEANLIKQHRPRFNIILRDDKNYPYLRLDARQQWPRFEVVRRIRRDRAAYFGPYVQAGSMREALRFINRHFGLRPCRYSLERPMRPCVEHQMGRCPAPCAGLMRRRDYMRSVAEAVLFLKGKKPELLGELEGRMQSLSEELRYEEAAEMRDRIGLLKKAWQSQKVISPGLGDLDVLGLFRGGRDAVFQVLFIRSGVMVGARHFYVRGVAGMPPEEMLMSFILGFYSGNVAPPGEITSGFLPEDAANLVEWLRGKKGGRVRMTVPGRGKRLELLRMAENNARHVYEARAASGAARVLEELAARLGLASPPSSIGAIDVSNLAGGEPVGAFVFWEDGEFKKDLYRHMKIKGVRGIDDYAMIRETVRRALEDLGPAGLMPDLLVIDGGRAHLEAALRALEGMKGTPDVVAVAKKPDRAFTRAHEGPASLEDRSPSSLLLKRIRDEVHRFAISFHKKLRGRRLMESPLEAVPGIGKKRRLALLKHFGSLEAVRKAREEDLASVPGMNSRAARALREALGAR
jgi:excinuclease ABC subunit C